VSVLFALRLWGIKEGGRRCRGQAPSLAIALDFKCHPDLGLKAGAEYAATHRSTAAVALLVRTRTVRTQTISFLQSSAIVAGDTLLF